MRGAGDSAIYPRQPPPGFSTSPGGIFYLLPLYPSSIRKQATAADSGKAVSVALERYPPAERCRPVCIAPSAAACRFPPGFARKGGFFGGCFARVPLLTSAKYGGFDNGKGGFYPRIMPPGAVIPSPASKIAPYTRRR
jgi:hypothetical protein